MRQESDDNFTVCTLAQTTRITRNIVAQLGWADDDRAPLWCRGFLWRIQWNDDSDGQTVGGQLISMPRIICRQIDRKPVFCSVPGKLDRAVRVFVSVRKPAFSAICVN
jgi:hypothetical protein